MTNDIEWWRESVVYQIYPRSFADSNGDGIGDINGIRSKVSYLAKLGIDAIWLSPHYVSPMNDAGYDVANYRDVDPIFGTLQDFEQLVTEVHDAGMRIICDIVPNHSSWDHPWFKEALAYPLPDGKGVPAKTRFAEGPWARYLLLRGAKDGAEAPNNWMSVFGGRAWSEIKEADGKGTGWWYLHIFDKSQPDLDWTNDEIRAEFRGNLRFWFDRGVDGLRIDVAHGLAKAEGYPDCPEIVDGDPSNKNPYWDQDYVHEIWREWRLVANEYEPNRIFVGEIWVGPASRSALYVRPDELHTGFNFDYMTAKWDGAKFRKIIDTALEADAANGAPSTWVLENHDTWRATTRYAPIIGGEDEDTTVSGNLDISKAVDWQSPRDLEVGRVRARAALLTMLALPGVAYMYNGQELALEEVFDIPAALRQDPAFHNTKGVQVGRDGCRVPLPWDNSSATFGFNSGSETWLPQPAGWSALAASEQEGVADSTLTLTQTALRLRKAEPALGGVTDDVKPLIWDKTDADVLSFVRPARGGSKGIRCVMNLSDKRVKVAASGQMLVESQHGAFLEGTLAPNTSVWLLEN